jgi:hypothetical protein
MGYLTGGFVYARHLYRSDPGFPALHAVVAIQCGQCAHTSEVMVDHQAHFAFTHPELEAQMGVWRSWG